MPGRPRPGPGRDGAPEGALRPGPDLPPGRLRRRDYERRLGSRAAPARAGPDPGLRALRLLPADVPDLRRLRGRDGLAARAHPADADRPRGGRDDLARDGHPLRPLPRLHGVRDRLPVGRAVRQADRAGAAADRALARRASWQERAYREAIFAVFTHPAAAARAGARAPARPEARAAGPDRAAAVDARARPGARPPTGRCASTPRRRRRPSAAPSRSCRAASSASSSATSTPPPCGCSSAEGWEVHAPRSPALLRRAADARGRRGGGDPARRGDDRRLRGLRHDRHQRRRLRLGDEGLRAPPGHRPRARVLGQGRRRPRAARRPRSRRPCASRSSCASPTTTPATSPTPRACARSRARCCAASPGWSCSSRASGSSAAARPASTTCSSPRPPPSSARARPRTCARPAPRRSPPPTRAARCRSPSTSICPIYHPMTLLDMSLRGAKP